MYFSSFLSLFLFANNTNVNLISFPFRSHRMNDRNNYKHTIQCPSPPVAEQQSSFFTITVYIEDINDNDPEFINLPYAITLDESTPIETVVFNRIKAIDRDKPNTPNSDVEYAIAPKQIKSGDFPFRLESSQRPKLILQRPLDYDAGQHTMNVLVIATDRGNPPRTANATVRVTIRDVDDLPPIFTRAVYRTKMKESYPVTVRSLLVLSRSRDRNFFFFFLLGQTDSRTGLL